METFQEIAVNQWHLFVKGDNLTNTARYLYNCGT